jgi:hypothetical protein
LIAIALAVLGLAAGGRILRAMPDFDVYWTAADRARTAAPLYRVEDGHYQFKYLPAFAILAIPLSVMPLASAKAVWFGASLALMATLVWVSIALLPERRWPAWMLATAAIVAMGKFFGHELLLGQVNLLFAVIATSALLALRSHQDKMAGVLIALAVIVKPYALLFLPWLAAVRRHAFIAATACVVAALVLPIVVYGAATTADLHSQWWGVVRDSTAPNLLNQDNVSLAAMYAKWLGMGTLATRLAALTSVVLIAAVILVCVRRGAVIAFPESLEGSLLLTMIPLLSPQGWDYVFLISTPAVVLVMNYIDRFPVAMRAVVIAAISTIGLSLFDVMGRANYAAFMSWSPITVCYLVVIAALVSLRVRGVA